VAPTCAPTHGAPWLLGIPGHRGYLAGVDPVQPEDIAGRARERTWAAQQFGLLWGNAA
jgi:hypothetical protein